MLAHFVNELKGKIGFWSGPVLNMTREALVVTVYLSLYGWRYYFWDTACTDSGHGPTQTLPGREQKKPDR